MTSCRELSHLRTLAFYLPQFHTIPENDEWWGEGFTEWVNVRRARPLFDGHAQPRVAGELGEYDLTQSDVRARQSELARQNGIDGFCMYYYSFGGHRLLERPVEAWREDSTLLPYCLAWANESWTRRWDGKSKSVLIAQTYVEGYAERLFADLLPHFQAPHYLHQDGKPILVVHRADHIPDAQAMARTLRTLALEAGLAGIHLVASETSPGLNPGPLDFDAIAEFPPVGANTLASAMLKPVKDVDPKFRGRLMSYDKLRARYTSRREPDFARYRGVAPGWDNTARRQEAATVYVGATPKKFALWLSQAQKNERAERGADGLVFVNAWNEWAEGAYLEPDALQGNEYLRAAADPLAYLPMHRDETVRGPAVWSLAQGRSIALATASSVLAAKRKVQNWVQTRATGA